ncbi:MAG TPA: hypothetical protein VF923_06830 [Gemmatimonadales bacterium]
MAASLIGVPLMMGCGFDAVLKSPGPTAVSFVFSDTLLTAGHTVPLAVSVIVGGVPQAHPYLMTFTDNPTVVDVTPQGDSLIARRSGVANITFRFKSTLRTSVADTTLPMRVRP